MSDPLNPFAPSTPPDTHLAERDIPHLEPPQSVEFALTPEMLAAFWSHRTHTSTSDGRTRRNNMLTALVLVITAPVVLVIVAVENRIPWWIGCVAFAYTVLIVLWFMQSLRRTTIDESLLREARRMMDESPNEQFKDKRTLIIEQRGVRQHLTHGETFLRWAGYVRIEHTDQHAFFYESSLTAAIVPRAAFASQSQFLGFVRLAQRLWQDHQADGDATLADQPSPNAEAV